MDRATSGALNTDRRDDQQARFERDGYLILPQILSPARVAALNAAIDKIVAEEPSAPAYNINCAVERHPLIADLMEEDEPLDLIVNHLGYNLQLHNSTLTVRKPVGDAGGQNAFGLQSSSGQHVSLNWHRDGPAPQFPRVEVYSAKVCFILSDMTEGGRGNTKVIPGSHHRPDYRPDLGDPEVDPPGAIEITGKPGDAFIFTQNLWHAAAPNRSNVERRLIFIGYSAFWARPADHIGEVTALMPGASPIRRQLIGEIGSRPQHRYMPPEDSTPLSRFWRGPEPVRSYA